MSVITILPTPAQRAEITEAEAFGRDAAGKVLGEIRSMREAGNDTRGALDLHTKRLLHHCDWKESGFWRDAAIAAYCSELQRVIEDRQRSA